MCIRDSTWTAAYLTAREGTELMLTENSTDPQVLRSRLHLLIGVPPVSYTHLDVYKRQA